MRTSVLPLPRRHSVPIVPVCGLLVDIRRRTILGCNLFLLLVRLKKSLRLVKVVLSSHALVSCTTRHRTLAICVGCGPPAVVMRQVVKIVEVVEH